MSVHLFDSSWDYYDSLLSEEDKLAIAIIEGDASKSITEDFLEFFETYYEDGNETDMSEAASDYSTRYFKMLEEF